MEVTDASIGRHLEWTIESMRMRARRLCDEFNERRRVRRQDGLWSDLEVRVRTDPGLSVEWYYRAWHSRERRESFGGRRYRRVHLTKRRVIYHAQDWERDEVVRVRDQLDALKESVKTLRRTGRVLTAQALTGDDADMLAGFRASGAVRRRASGEVSGKD